MSTHQDDAVRSLLRISENLECLLDVELAENGARRTLQSDPNDPTDTHLRHHLIAVVTHRHDFEDRELGRWVLVR